MLTIVEHIIVKLVITHSDNIKPCTVLGHFKRNFPEYPQLNTVSGIETARTEEWHLEIQFASRNNTVVQSI